MIREHAAVLAAQMGVMLSKVTLREGQALGSIDAFLLSLEADGLSVSEYIHQSDLERLQNSSSCDCLDRLNSCKSLC